MENNAWRYIKSDDYAAHMSHPNVAQTQMLNRIVKEQFELLLPEQHSDSCVAILGITTGNGLEHVVPHESVQIIGIDINRTFLDECRERFREIESRLSLLQLDLMSDTLKSVEILSKCNLIIANLLISHIHLDCFIKIMAGLPKRNQIVSCVIQINPDGAVVSKSDFEHVFDAISDQQEEENEDLIVSSMNKAGFAISNRIVYDLPNRKQFIRLDFIAI